MHFDNSPVASGPADADTGPWYSGLTRYHWFVLIVAALGWLFDTMDQQLFNLARVPAMRELLIDPAPSPETSTVTSPTPEARKSADDQRKKAINWYAGLSTAVFMIGWASGGLA